MALFNDWPRERGAALPRLQAGNPGHLVAGWRLGRTQAAQDRGPEPEQMIMAWGAMAGRRENASTIAVAELRNTPVWMANRTRHLQHVAQAGVEARGEGTAMLGGEQAREQQHLQDQSVVRER